jgi:hypothetical protein
MSKSEVRNIGRSDGRFTGGTKVVLRMAAAGVIFLGALGVASPSWAGPLMGC